MNTVLQDLRYAARQFARRPGFTAVAVFTIALGIGATTSMFGVVDALFLSPPAGVRGADEVVRVYVARDEGSIQTGAAGPGSYVDYEAMREGARGFDELAVISYPREVDLGRGEEARRVTGQMVSHTFFDVLGARSAEGRFFGPADTAATATPAVVISQRFRQRHFAGEPEVVGRTLLLNGQVATVVGVAAEGFTGIEVEPVDVWIPAAHASALGVMWEGWRTNPYMAGVSFIARLGSSGREAASASASAALRHAAESADGLDPDPQVVLGPLNRALGPIRSSTADMSLWLALATGLVLLVATANVANLLLARATQRRREIAVRLSLGVSRGRLLRQLLTESVALALLGAVGGLVLALWGAELVRQFPVPPAAGVLDWRMLAFAGATAVTAGILFGLAPALQAVRTDPIAGLKDASPSGAPSRGRARAALVASQVALALVALVGAGLFVRSFQRVLAIDAGVDLDRVAIVSIDLGNAGYDRAAKQAFWDRVGERLSALPGVERVSSARVTPLSGVGYGIGLDLPGPDSLAIEGEGPYTNWAMPGYFRTVGMRLIDGRAFTDADREGAPPVAVVNASLARAIAPDGRVVGRCLQVLEQREEGGCTEIVGIVADRRHRFLQEPVPYVILPWLQHADAGSGVGSLLVRTAGDPDELLGALRATTQGLAADLPYVSVRPLRALVREDLLPYQLGAALSALFGVLALLLAAMGLYGVLAYTVAERTREIGVRRSLGAGARHIVRFVVRRALGPVGVGLAIGLAAALAGTRLLSSLLYGVPPRDPVTFVVIPLVLLAVALVATAVPARRASRVDPMEALRHE